MGWQLEMRNVVKDYKKFRAVNQVNLQIEKGEIVSLLGASGCGKTTTLKMIAGLLPVTEGEIWIAGKNITEIPPYKRDISMVFQNYALFPHMTVYENIVYGLKNRGVKDKKVLEKKAEEVLGIVQLQGVEKRYPKQLSGGQQQRVSLARALIVEPAVMLFDEPLSNLDAKLRVQTRVEIRTLLKSLNITAVYVTHDQEEALTISDRIAVMNQGRIEQITTPEHLYNMPATKFVADFIGQANLIEGEVSKAQGRYGTVNVSKDMQIQGMIVGKECKEGDKRAVLIRPENVEIWNEPKTGENCFKGKVLEKSFLGSSIRYEIQLEAGIKIQAQLHPDEAQQIQGCEVFVYCDKEKAVLIKQ